MQDRPIPAFPWSRMWIIVVIGCAVVAGHMWQWYKQDGYISGTSIAVALIVLAGMVGLIFWMYRRWTRNP